MVSTWNTTKFNTASTQKGYEGYTGGSRALSAFFLGFSLGTDQDGFIQAYHRPSDGSSVLAGRLHTVPGNDTKIYVYDHDNFGIPLKGSVTRSIPNGELTQTFDYVWDGGNPSSLNPDHFRWETDTNGYVYNRAKPNLVVEGLYTDDGWMDRLGMVPKSGSILQRRWRTNLPLQGASPTPTPTPPPPPPSPMNCEWEWSDWTDCSRSCDGGTQTRSANVTQPAAHGGTCDLPSEQTRACNTHACPPDPSPPSSISPPPYSSPIISSPTIDSISTPSSTPNQKLLPGSKTEDTTGLFWNFTDFDSNFFDLNNGALYIYGLGILVFAVLAVWFFVVNQPKPTKKRSKPGSDAAFENQRKGYIRKVAETDKDRKLFAMNREIGNLERKKGRLRNTKKTEDSTFKQLYG